MKFTQDLLKVIAPQAIFWGKKSIELQKISQELPQELLDREFFFSIDSRTIQKNELFVACRGENLDGHQFIAQALTHGAGVILANDKQEILEHISDELRENKLIMVVTDPVQAFILLAAAWRAQFAYPVVAITGSVGKTSTKFFTQALCQYAGKNVLISPGNYNTLLGVALTIVHMSSEYQVAIFEVGIQKLGEMTKIAALLKPTHAVITYLGHSHMLGLGSMGVIAAEKRALFSALTSDGMGIINGDFPLLKNVGYVHQVMTFGLKMNNYIQARKIKKTADGGASFILKIYEYTQPMVIAQYHTGVINTILASCAAAYALGIPAKTIGDALEKLPVVGQRFELCKLKNYQGIVINDCYNASPESMRAALLAFHALSMPGKKIAILGDMLELGAKSAFWHKKMGLFLKFVPSIHHLILIGSQVTHLAQALPKGLSVALYSSWQEAIEPVQSLVEVLAQEQDGVGILVKASRGMQLQHLVHNLTQDFVQVTTQEKV